LSDAFSVKFQVGLKSLQCRYKEVLLMRKNWTDINYFGPLYTVDAPNNMKMHGERSVSVSLSAWVHSMLLILYCTSCIL